MLDSFAPSPSRTHARVRTAGQAGTHARVGFCAKYLGASTYKYATDEIDSASHGEEECVKRGRWAKHARTEPSDDGKIFGRRANFHSTVNTRRAEGKARVRTKINLYCARALFGGKGIYVRSYARPASTITLYL